MLNFKNLYLLIVLSSLGFLVGCGGGDNQSSSETGNGSDNSSAEALRIAYSDWPGWVAWEIGKQKGFFKDAGVEVEFIWLDYVPSMDSFVAGKVDAVCMTNGDALVTGSTGKKGIGILINDYSNGNDMVVARQGIDSVAALKGKKIGVEKGFVPHLLLLKALESAGLSEADVTLIGVPTDKTPETLATGDVDAISAWQPNSGQALKLVGGSKAVFTSEQIPGIIYDLLYVSPESLAARHGDWEKVVKVWFQIVDFMNDPSNKQEVLEILSARVQIKPDEYEPLLNGTRILTLAENKERFKDAEGLESVVGSSRIVNEFNVANEVYKTKEKVEDYLDSSFVDSL
jgi:NitT/TauT family transport system substrate-binding protein